MPRATASAGSPAPALDLPVDGGGHITSAGLAGKPYVIYFYPKDDTPGCTKEAIGFSCVYDQFKAAGVEVIGVSKDSVASHGKFRNKHELGVQQPDDTVRLFNAATVLGSISMTSVLLDAI